MYVLEITNNGTTPFTIIPGVLSLPAGASKIFPAEDCVWEQVNAPDGTGYRIQQAYFIKRVDANTYSTELAGTGSAADNSAKLGYIGKSGRFVPITE